MKFGGLIAFVLVGLTLLVGIGCGGGGGGGSTSGGGTGGLDGKSRIRGSVFIDGTVLPIANVEVQIFDLAGIIQGTGVTDALGKYQIDVPQTATTIFLKRSSVNTGTFYGSFYYKNDSFQLSIATCKAKLPALAADTAYDLTAIEIPLRSDPPPPPPSGCN
ncbi:MAG: hypothetical protein K8R88_12465 [Armatimonadetes bacterium]|nr:hypothetical protein [Armatimonadota bacterium]